MGRGLPLEVVKKIGIKDVTTQVCISMIQYTRDHEQDALSSFSSNKVVKTEFQQSTSFRKSFQGSKHTSPFERCISYSGAK